MSRHWSEARLGDQTIGSEDKSVSDVELPQQCLIKEYSRLQAMSQLELEAGAVWRFFSLRFPAIELTPTGAGI